MYKRWEQHGYALAGKWQLRVGPRAAMLAAAACFGGGLVLGGAGVASHNLALLYAGYGLLGGCGVGIAYTPPVQALIQWFPDRKGLASGMTIAGFGSGALVFAPLAERLLRHFSTPAEYAGAFDAVDTVTRDGRLYHVVDAGGAGGAGGGEALREVVAASAGDLAKLVSSTAPDAQAALAEGFYYVGTGSTGVAPALAVLGAGYLGVMTAAAFAMKKPAPGYAPPGFVPPEAAAAAESLRRERSLLAREGNKKLYAAAKGSGSDVVNLKRSLTRDGPRGVRMRPPRGNVPLDGVMKTPQFYMLATTFFCVACGGMGLMSVAAPMMGEVFSGSLPHVVTASFASSYLLMMSGGNLGGRLGWAAFSDRFGRRASFHLFTLGSVPLYLAVPACVGAVVTTGDVAPLYGFIGVTVAAISAMGGVYAILPAYEADLFGAKYVGPIHGRFLLASTAASLAGPSILLGLRSAAERASIADLVAACDPARFERHFGAPVEAAQSLVEAKTLTIAKLMELAPAGTQDPSPFIYDSTMYTMAGFMAVAAASHWAVGPVDEKHFEEFKDKQQRVVDVEGHQVADGETDDDGEDAKAKKKIF